MTRRIFVPGLDEPSSTMRECPVCASDVPVVNYAIQLGGEVGYLGAHTRRGLRPGAKCRGSFGPWVAQQRSAR